MNTPRTVLFALVASLASVSSSYADSTLSINGAGATFPYPLYSKWFSDFRKVDPSVEINYQSIGSGGGIRQLLETTVDFGASDAPMKDEELAQAKAKTGSPVLHFPTTLGAVVLTYNLPEVKQPLSLAPDVIADIFLGKITAWNDAKIAALNPGVALPSTPVMVVRRADGSGTTAVFTDYLSKVSPAWKEKVGAGSQIKWPVGLGGKGNEGVTGMIKQSPGAIGYVELLYSEKNKLPAAKIKNAAGQFVTPSTASITAAAAAELKHIPADFRVSITNAGGKESYPIASFTYLLFYENASTPEGKAKLQKMKGFLTWAVGDGQKSCAELFYAPLPSSLVPKVKAQIGRLASAGK